ncbi:MAG: ribosome maturation factor RimM [Solirubrobacteraceae bacterium]
MSQPSGWLRAGKVGRPHGLDGAVYVGEPNLLLLEVGSQLRAGSAELHVTRRAGDHKRVIIWFDECRDRPAAEALRGQQLLASRVDAPALAREEWWAEDLEGCLVRDGSRPVGTVARMRSLPSCEILEVRRDPDAGDLLVPLISDAVRTVDLVRREIDVDLRFLGET